MTESRGSRDRGVHGLERGHHPRCLGDRQPDRRWRNGVPPFKVTTVRCGPRRSGVDLRGVELVIVPGLGTPSADELETKLKSPMCRRAVDMLSRAHAPAPCSPRPARAPSCWRRRDLLDGRRATTTWWFAPLFRQRYPAVELLTEQMVVADWPIATGGAAMAQMDLMLAVVGRFAGPSLARACANYLLLDERRSQAPFMAITYLASQDPRIAKAEKWVRDNIARDFAIEELADAVALAPRTFARRVSATCGVSPIQFVQRIRLETARFLLETTRLSGRGDRAEGRICGAFHAAPADPARYETSARTFPARRVSVSLARDVASLSGPVWPSPRDILQIRKPRTHAHCRTACSRQRAGCGRKARR